MNCSRCHRKFTEKTRKEVKCSCSYSLCKSCLSKIILTNSSEFVCPFCKFSFQENILKENLSKTIFSQWKKKKNKIEKIQVLGSGGFGECSLIKRGGGYFVLKEPIKRGVNESFQNEINIHKLLSHPNIVPYCNSFFEKGKPHILLYPCMYGSLNDILQKIVLTDEKKKIFIGQTIKGLQYLEKMNIIHRDIKQHNLLLDENMTIRIGDFGLSTIIKKDKLCYSNCGTTNFKAPEILKGKGYSFEVDRWSLGILIYYLFLKEYPFQHFSRKKTEENIILHKFTFPKYSSIEERTFLRWILNPKQKKRPTLEEIKTHVFLR